MRLGTHLLTGEKVAIKCMDKEKLGEDLFRVQTEIRALKVLDHQNIAKLLQVIETDTKIYLILEVSPLDVAVRRAPGPAAPASGGLGNALVAMRRPIDRSRARPARLLCGCFAGCCFVGCCFAGCCFAWCCFAWCCFAGCCCARCCCT